MFEFICRPLRENADYGLAQGISEVLFEMIYGAGQDLNSNASVIFEYLLKDQAEDDAYLQNFRLMTRILFVKLFNEIDTHR